MTAETIVNTKKILLKYTDHDDVYDQYTLDYGDGVDCYIWHGESYMPSDNMLDLVGWFPEGAGIQQVTEGFLIQWEM